LSRRATIWTIVAVLLLVLPYGVLLSGELPGGRGFWWDLSMGLGFGALAMLGLQFALTARFRRITHPFGIDALYLFHRVMAIGAVAVVLGHFGILYVGYEDALGELDPLTARWELTAGRVALVCFLLLVVTSELRRRLRLEYGLWRHLHAALAVLGFAAAVAHVMAAGSYTNTPGKTALWLGVTLGFLGLLVWVRAIKPYTQLRQPWRVAENRAEQGGAHTLVLEPVGHPGLGRWQPGQFAWLTLKTSPFFLREHPFTIASSPEQGPRLEMAIKPQGDFTTMTQSVATGETAYLDGPYGTFSVDRYPEARGFVMVAGGIGITPMLANLRAMADRGDKRRTILFFANPTRDDIAFRDELDTLRQRLDLHLVHNLEDPPEDWSGETGLLTAEVLDRHLDARTRTWPHFLCGPVPMTAAVTAALVDLGVARGDIHTEIFELA
jgi:predicted ferric reductase